jgi:general secretion pathway protein J
MQTPPRLARRQIGFTLVELLVAMLIMSMISVMAWQGVDSITRTREASQARLESTLRINAVLAQWEYDLAALQETGLIPALSFDGASLRLTRRSDQGIQLVTWSLRSMQAAGVPENANQSSKTWLRWTSPPLTNSQQLQDQWQKSQQLFGTEAKQVHTLVGLQDWQVYFYRGNAWTNAQSSAGASVGVNPVVVQNPGSSNGSAIQPQFLPSGVRLVLNFGPASGRVGTLTRDIALGPQLP